MPSSTQLRMEFMMLINVTMPIIVGILRFISMLKITFESKKSLQHFSFMSS